MSEEKKKKEIALFRYGLISPVIHGHIAMQKRYFEEMAQKEHDVPHLGRKKYKPETIRHWLKVFKRGGFDALLPKGRVDKGQSRKISDELAEEIRESLEKYPWLSGSALYRTLISSGSILPGGINEGTLRKFIKDNNLKEPTNKTPRKKFEMELINQLWTADAMHGYYIKSQTHKRKQKTYLIAAIDDHSRVITARQWTLAENTISFARILKQGIQLFGLPEKLYCDNGSLFSSNYLQLACARLGIALIHSKPYDSPSRGKIERFFRTVRQKFLPILNLEEIDHIDQLNDRFEAWLEKDYHKHLHTGIGEKPMDRFINSIKNTNIKRITEEQLDLAFQTTIYRTVKNDATVSINAKLYECPPETIGKKIEIRYSWNEAPDYIYYQNNKPVAKLSLVNPQQNANIPAWEISFANKKEA